MSKYILTRNKKLLGAPTSLLGARTLLGAPGFTTCTRSKKLLGTMSKTQCLFEEDGHNDPLTSTNCISIGTQKTVSPYSHQGRQWING